MSYLVPPCFAGFGGDKQSLVHFIWIGIPNLKKEEIIATLGPKSLVDQMRKNVITSIIHPKVLLWVQNAAQEKFQELLHDYPEIEIHSLDSLFEYNEPDTGNRYEFPSDELVSLKSIFDNQNGVMQRNLALYHVVNNNLIKNKKEHKNVKNLADIVADFRAKLSYSYTYQKDFISLLVIAQYGGYYFDTSVMFYGLPDFFNQDMDKKLISHSSYKKIMELDFSWSNTPNQMRWLSTGIDIWAFAASKPGDDLYRGMVRRYVREYQTIQDEKEKGIEVGDNSSPSSDFPSYFASTLDKEFPTEETFEKMIWFTSLVKKEEFSFWDVPELKFYKLNAGLWRGCSESCGHMKKEFWQKIGLSDSDFNEVTQE